MTEQTGLYQRDNMSILKYLYGLERFGIKPGLTRIRRLLKELDNPHLDFKAIHVAGTNGKGSVCSFLHAILSGAGYTAGLYTSPHLIKFNERIRVGDRLIADKDLDRLTRRIKAAASRSNVTAGKLTFFEFTTALAFLYFKEKGVDVAVIETGMGGRLDATNVVTPLVSIITTIALDHTEYLGEDITAITAEKAGIIKDGVPVITGVTDKAALRILRQRARLLNCRVYAVEKDFSAASVKEPLDLTKGSSFDYSGIKTDIAALKINLRGAHQFRNASCALAAVEVLSKVGFSIPISAARRALSLARWDGRLQIIQKKPLVIIDAAHNPEGARALAAALKKARLKNLTLVLGIMSDKDIDGILEDLVPLSSAVVVTRPATARAATIDTLAKKILPYKKEVRVSKRVSDGCKIAVKLAGRNGAVCVAGSIFTAAEAGRFFLSLQKRDKGL